MVQWCNSKLSSIVEAALTMCNNNALGVELVFVGLLSFYDRVLSFPQKGEVGGQITDHSHIYSLPNPKFEK